MRLLPPALLALGLSACAALPPPPDYDAPASWAARPETRDAADVNPEGVKGVDPATAKVDVFFIHPTSYFGLRGTAPIDDPETMRTTAQDSIANQASVFNGCCRVYAPRYRQAGIGTYIWIPEKRAEVDWLRAYGDVKRAFANYYAHDNHGRPFIIASHSQGSRYALWLIQDMIEGTPLQKQFVAAYVVGYGIPKEWFTRNLKTIGMCHSATDLGCVMNWNSYEPDGDPSRIRDKEMGRYGDHFEANEGKPLVCTNPLTWRTDDQHADRTLNLGAWAIIDGHDGPPWPGFTGARCDDGALLVDPLDAKDRQIPQLRKKNLHVVDYQLWYMNIRQNAAARAAAFLAAHPGMN